MASDCILIVDDMADARTLLRILLVSKGHYKVLEAADGLEALQIAHEHPPDLILLDYMMPKIDGLEVSRRLKRHTKTAHIPIVMITAYKDRGIRDQAIASGVSDLLFKPLVPGTLLEKIQSQLLNRPNATATAS